MKKGAFVRMRFFHKVRPDSAKKSIYHRFTASFGLFFPKSLTPALETKRGQRRRVCHTRCPGVEKNSSEIHGKSVLYTLHLATKYIMENTSKSAACS